MWLITVAQLRIIDRGELNIKSPSPRAPETKPDNKDSKKTLINEEIRAREVRLIGAEGQQIGVVPLREALAAAEEAELDLVQISSGDPIVCKLMDYGKFVYDAKKQQAEARKNQVRTTIKEVKFRPGTEEGDYQVKLRNLIRFLEHGDKTKVTLRFRGREMAHQEIGMQLMKRVEADLSELAAVEQFPKMEGRQMTMMLSPKKRKK